MVLLSLGCAYMAVHSSLVKGFDGCPVTVLVGKSGRGKTQAMKLGMATIGKQTTFRTKLGFFFLMGNSGGSIQYFNVEHDG